MAKRSADKELTDRNWDQEDPVEEAGTFTKASDDQIKKRQIKKAKRRGVAGVGSSDSPGSAFSGFGGFTGFKQSQGLSNGSSTKPGLFTSTPTLSSSTASKSSPVVEFKPTPIVDFKTNTAVDFKPTPTVDFKTSTAVDFKASPTISFKSSSTTDDQSKVTTGVSFKPFGSEMKKAETAVPSFASEGPSKTMLTNKTSYNTQYCKQLRSLNEAVCSWIQKHVKENPLCDLSPVFRDYEKHLKMLEEKFPPMSSESEGEKSQDETPSRKARLQTESLSSEINTPGSTGFAFKSETSLDTSTFSVPQTKSATPLIGTTTATVKPSFEFGAKTDSGSTDSTPKSTFSFSNTDAKSGFTFAGSGSSGASGFSFGAKDTKSSLGSASTLGGDTAKSGFSFGAKNTKSSFGSASTMGSDTAKSGFSFGISKPQEKSEPQAAAAATEDDEDQPPKVEVKQVEEKDALHSVRCKLFFKKGGSFVDRGIGMLHLKKSGSVLQMLIRADTNLGNILLNIGIPSSLPITKQGKNNMMFISAPNPPGDKVCPQCKKKYPNPQETNECESGCKPEAIPILVRVKTGEMVDTLIEKINEFKE